MSDQAETPEGSSSDDTDQGWSQVIFIAIGLAIVLGGLWLLYQSEGPYHPDQPANESQVQLLDES